VRKGRTEGGKGWPLVNQAETEKGQRGSAESETFNPRSRNRSDLISRCVFPALNSSKHDRVGDRQLNLARALPPFSPPSLPSATAAAFLLSLSPYLTDATNPPRLKAASAPAPRRPAGLLRLRGSGGGKRLQGGDTGDDSLVDGSDALAGFRWSEASRNQSAGRTMTIGRRKMLRAASATVPWFWVTLLKIRPIAVMVHRDDADRRLSVYDRVGRTVFDQPKGHHLRVLDRRFRRLLRSRKLT